MARELKLYRRYIRMHFLAGLEYKGWWLALLQTLAVCVSDVISTFLLFGRFGGVGSWSVERIVLIYALALTAFGLAESFCRGFDYFPWRMLRSGDFDRLLLRPKSLFTQVAGSVFHIHRLARVAAGLAVIFWALAKMGVRLTPFRAGVLLLAIFGGVLTYTGVFILSSGIAFFTISSLDWIYILTNASYQVTRIPHELMPKLLKHMFTFFMPMLVVSYYPASVVCGWGEPTWTGLLAFPAGALFLTGSVMVWRLGVRHYKSTGS